MMRSIAVGGLAGLALSLIAAPLPAQTTVQGSVVVYSGPSTGQVEVRRRTRIISPSRHVIEVQRINVPRGWWKRHSYRVMTVYYDGRRYYLRRFDRPNLRPVIVYERGGRYYIDEDRWKRDHGRHNGNGHRDKRD
jgi:hypothetical protein